MSDAPRVIRKRVAKVNNDATNKGGRIKNKEKSFLRGSKTMGVGDRASAVTILLDDIGKHKTNALNGPVKSDE